MRLFGRNQKGNSGGKRLLLLGGGSAALMYLFDPQMGRTRRARLQDRIGAFVRRGARRTEAKSSYLAGKTEGIRQRSTGAGSGAPPPNDPALVAKVESEVFQGTGFTKDRINLNAENGIVVLRGSLDSADEIHRFEEAVRGVTGVVEVQNLMHVPGEPAPNKSKAQRVGGM